VVRRGLPEAEVGRDPARAAPVPRAARDHVRDPADPHDRRPLLLHGPRHVRDRGQERDADITIEAIGKQWSWDFNYLGPDVEDTSDDVYDTGQHAKDVGRNGVLADQVTLYLPVGKRVQFELRSRDVIHSFWIPAFLYKKDMIPGRENSFQVVPMREGAYLGKCAELCGEEHSGMLFNVKVVSQEEYEAHLADLRDRGQTGSLGLDRSRHQDLRSQTEGTGGTD